MKKFLLTLTILATAFLPASAVRAETKLESTLEGVKGQVENLVTAKDEKSGSELALRIETFKKVIEFSVSEAKDLKIKLLALEDLSEDENAWRENVIKELNNALVYYESEKAAIEDTSKIDLDEIKALATDFKEWRDTTYLPIAEKINEFLLIHQEENAIEIAERRWQKIDEDIKKLEKAKIKGVSELRQLLNDAGTIIGEGKNLNREAGGLFWENYILTDASSTTSTPASVVVTPVLPEELNATTTASSTEVNSTSTDESASSTLAIQPPSIRDLVEDSLVKIKDAYQVFIEMSSLVRKLLN